MAFQFSMASVLRIREILEEREESLLQKIGFEAQQARDALARSEVEIAESDVVRRSEMFKSIIGRHLHGTYAELKALRQSREELGVKIERLEQLRKKQLAVYEAARRNREMLTDIHREQRSAYDADNSRREQKAIDDNYISRRGRR